MAHSPITCLFLMVLAICSLLSVRHIRIMLWGIFVISPFIRPRQFDLPSSLYCIWGAYVFKIDIADPLSSTYADFYYPDTISCYFIDFSDIFILIDIATPPLIVLGSFCVVDWSCFPLEYTPYPLRIVISALPLCVSWMRSLPISRSWRWVAKFPSAPLFHCANFRRG